MVTGAWNQIMSIMQQRVTAMALQLNGAEVPVVIRKLPLKMETIDPATQILIVPDETPPKIERYGMATPTYPTGIARTRFMTDIVVVSPNNLDYAKHIPTYVSWLQLISETFSAPTGLVFGSQSVDGLQDCRCQPKQFLAKSKLNASYDYIAITCQALVIGPLT